MLKSIRLHNFRSHKDTFLEFSQGMNAIIGDTQAGKSAILKAINWVKNNRPLNDNIFYEDSKKAFVEIEFTENNKIKLEKKRTISKSGNVKIDSIYYVNDTKLEVFNKTPPKEVTDIFNLSEINIQNQSESSFLITDTPGEIARKINEVTNLDVATNWIKTLTTTVNSKNSEIKIIEKDIELLEEDLIIYEGLESLEVIFNRLDKITNKLDKKRTKFETIKNLNNQYYLLNQNISIKKTKLEQITILFDEFKEIINRLDTLYRKEKSLHIYQNKTLKVNILNKAISNVNIFEISKSQERLNLFEEKKKNLHAYQNKTLKVNTLNKAIFNIEKLLSSKIINFQSKLKILKEKHKLLSDHIHYKKQIELTKEKIQDYENEYIKTLKQAGKCPLCFQSTKEIFNENNIIK